MLLSYDDVYAVGRILAEKAGVTDIIEEKEIGIATKIKNKGKSIIKKIPFVGKFLDNTDDKIDHIHERQTRSIAKIKNLSHNALDIKGRIEEIYFLKKRTFDTSKDIFNSIKNAQMGKLFASLSEKALGIPINPADYIPETNSTSRRIKENLNIDLSLEKGIVNDTHFLFRDSTRDLIYQLDKQKKYLSKNNRIQQEVTKAERYDNELLKAMHTKKLARAKLYNAEIAQLKEEIKNLKQLKDPSKLNAKEILQLEILIDQKQERCNNLNEKIDKVIEENLTPTQSEQDNLLVYSTTDDINYLLKNIVKNK